MTSERNQEIADLRRVAFDSNVSMGARQAAYVKFQEMTAALAREINEEFFGKPDTPKDSANSFIESA